MFSCLCVSYEGLCLLDTLESKVKVVKQVKDVYNNVCPQIYSYLHLDNMCLQLYITHWQNSCL